jgi:hypothetical protein
MLKYDNYPKPYFLYHKPKICAYVIHIMIHLHLANDFWNLKFLKLYQIFKNFKYQFFLIMNIFLMWIVGYHHFKKIPIKIPLLKESLA